MSCSPGFETGVGDRHHPGEVLLRGWGLTTASSAPSPCLPQRAELSWSPTVHHPTAGAQIYCPYSHSTGCEQAAGRSAAVAARRARIQGRGTQGGGASR